MSDENDDALMARAQAGSMATFGILVRRHQALLLRTALRLLDDSDAAQDAAQEAFVRLWQLRDRYQPQGQLVTLLLTLLRNICRDQQRRVRVRDTPAPIGNAPPSPEQCATSAALAQAVRDALRALPDVQREVFVLHHYEQRTYDEIARIVGCPIGTVASRKRQAVLTLRAVLREWEHDNEEE